MEISFNGAAYVAAHQYIVSKEGPGYTSQTRDEMEQLGKAIFQYYFKTVNKLKSNSMDSNRIRPF